VLHSFFGYSDSPTPLQLIVYVAYLAIVIAAFLGLHGVLQVQRKAPQPAVEPRPAVESVAQAELPGMRASCHAQGRGCFPRTSTPQEENMPPFPRMTLMSGLSIWAAASPRTWRTPSWMANIPYMPVWV
jgi:hypothetical protein